VVYRRVCVGSRAYFDYGRGVVVFQSCDVPVWEGDDAQGISVEHE